MAVSISLGVVTIKFVYYLCFEREMWEKIARRGALFLLPSFWRLARLFLIQKWGCTNVRTSEVWIYNNGKHWALKQDQVMSSFAPPGTTGWPLPCDERVPHDKARFMTVAVRAFPQTSFNAALFPEGWPTGVFVGINLGRELTCLNLSIIC